MVMVTIMTMAITINMTINIILIALFGTRDRLLRYWGSPRDPAREIDTDFTTVLV
jgi:hypothetical protein